MQSSRIYSALMYHQTTAPAQDKYYVSIPDFREQIKLIKTLDIESVSLENKSFPKTKRPPVLITFDDGHKSNLEAAEILTEYGLKGYFYVVKDFSLNNPAYLNEDDILKISNMGHTIAVHGKDHNWWILKSNEQLIQELTETKNWIESITGKPVITCAAPGGVLNERVIQCIKEFMPEYKYIRTVKVGMNNVNDELIKIVPMHTHTNIQMFKWSITNNNLYYKYLQSIYYSKEILRPIYNLIRK